MKRSLLPLFLFLISFSSGYSQVLAAASFLPPPPQVAGSAYLLVDADSGHIIVEQNADQALAPASLTKLMTSYVLYHELAEGRVSEADQVLISREAWAQNPIFAGSSLMWIEAGKRVSLADLNRGLVISSGNDAAVAIAEHLAGSESAFANMMNSHARALGMTGTHFVNSHGLPAADHYTTARDLAVLSNALINRFPDDYALYKEHDFTYNNIRQYNRNSLLTQDPSVDGLKTGYTEDAGYCLVASAKRDGMRLISVVLGASSKRGRATETRKLLNYGFRFYETHDLYQPGQELSQAQVWKGLQKQVGLGIEEQIYLTIPRGRHEDLKAVIEVQETIVAPVEVGQSFGELSVSLDGQVVMVTRLVATSSVESSGFFARLWDSILMFLAQIFGD
jgi:D-alanyl-D-alanine carboxypeptidase (penicillin-binding protein 5/6)